MSETPSCPSGSHSHWSPILSQDLRLTGQIIQPGFSVLTKLMYIGPITVTHGFQHGSQLVMMLGDL